MSFYETTSARLAVLAAFVVASLGSACAERGPGDQASSAPKARLPDVSESWPRPRSDERVAERERMVAKQVERRGVRNETVLEAMRNVPRHWFMPEGVQHLAYADRAVPIGNDQTISQPYIVAAMTDALKLTSEMKVLEIGTGSGYQAAVCAEITPRVYTVEIVEPLAKRAIATFKRHGYDTIKTRIGDGYAGWPVHAPFDAVMVTCAPDHVPPALIEQLAPGGRICIPVGARHGVQRLRLITKAPDGVVSEDLEPVRFVPMTGEAQRRNNG